jgi:hypothetical protein
MWVKSNFIFQRWMSFVPESLLVTPRLWRSTLCHLSGIFLSVHKALCTFLERQGLSGCLSHTVCSWLLPSIPPTSPYSATLSCPLRSLLCHSVQISSRLRIVVTMAALICCPLSGITVALCVAQCLKTVISPVLTQCPFVCDWYSSSCPVTL